VCPALKDLAWWKALVGGNGRKEGEGKRTKAKVGCGWSKLVRGEMVGRKAKRWEGKILSPCYTQVVQ
jgi:hypothetical protein